MLGLEGVGVASLLGSLISFHLPHSSPLAARSFLGNRFTGNRFTCNKKLLGVVFEATSSKDAISRSLDATRNKKLLGSMCVINSSTRVDPHRETSPG